MCHGNTLCAPFDRFLSSSTPGLPSGDLLDLGYTDGHHLPSTNFAEFISFGLDSKGMVRDMHMVTQCAPLKN